MQTTGMHWVTDSIRRILAPNPSAMTGPGTNTYIIGRGADVAVVDPGPLDESHIAAVQAALSPNETVTAIIVTHAHTDHSAAAARLSALTSAPVLAFGDARSGRNLRMQHLAEAGQLGGGEGADLEFRPHRRLSDGETLKCGDHVLRVIHTPGHMGCHICLAVGDVLLSGDHAMGWASSLISPPDGDMGDYMASLDRLSLEKWSVMLPGHGNSVFAVAARLQTLADHRRQREREVLAALEFGPSKPAELTRSIYHDIPAALIPAAQRNVLAHLIDLFHKKLVSCDVPPGPDTIFALS